MKSPFPGMDPYIEARGLWEDFHSHLIEKIYDTLADAVPANYVVRTTERSYISLVEAEGKETRSFQPDVSVATPGSAGPAPARGENIAVAEPETDTEGVPMIASVTEEFRESFVEIYYKEDDFQLVTCIEVLSPSNKRKGSDGWDVYLRKRQALMQGTANLIEIDLLRGGQKFPMLNPWPPCPYTLLVCRRVRAPHCRAYRAYSLKPLPPLSVPLAIPDPDVALDLQPLLEGIYARSRYHLSIDYSTPCQPPLSDDENAWLHEQLQCRQTQA